MLLNNKVIIFLGNARFDGEIKSTSFFIAQNLAKNNKVYFVDYPFTWKDYFVTSFNTKELRRRKRKFSPFSDGRIQTKTKNLEILVTIPVLPINFIPEGRLFRKLLSFNQTVIARRLKNLIKNEHITDFIYINAFNFHYPDIAKIIKPRLSVYQCVDPMIVPYDMKHGILSENQLVKESDVVICTSRALYEEKRTENKCTYFVPNGTDIKVSSSEAVTTPLSPKLASLPSPIVGYLGTIERRIDYVMIQEVIKANPEKSFVFAGPVSPGFVPDGLYNLANVYFLGPIAHDEVEQVINSFDVAIIPFKKDEVSKTIFPIKLFEYLSAGKAVVATDFNDDLQEYTDDSVQYCKDAVSFSAAIKYSLENDSEERKQVRRVLAKNNTWEIRAEEISKILYTHLKR